MRALLNTVTCVSVWFAFSHLPFAVENNLEYTTNHKMLISIHTIAL